MFATSVVLLVPVVPVVKEVTQDIQVKQVKLSVAKAKKSATSMERYAFLFFNETFAYIIYRGIFTWKTNLEEVVLLALPHAYVS